jgi:hypothetical protein
MERLVRINEATIKKYKPDEFALQKIFKELDVTYEYQVAGAWVAGRPTQKPEGKRIVFDDVERFRVGRDVYFAWKAITEIKAYDPMLPEKVIQRLLNARQAKFLPDEYSRYPLYLFVPWGVRPEGEFGDPEKAALEKIRSLQVILNNRGVNAQVLIMPADLYATEVNRQVSNDDAAKYFDNVTLWANYRGFFAKPWSEIRQDNRIIYQERTAKLTNEEIAKILGKNIVNEALEAAGRRSGYNDKVGIEKAAFAYLRERICEAEIIETAYKPIKVSAVGKNKDNGVDRELPRIYILPSELQFPWLK